MELLYVWIEDFKNIRRQGFNLSPKHWFEFTPQKEKGGKVTGGTLTHETRNQDYPDQFFGKNISNITAIVGKNGSGKSTLMESLLKFTLGSSTRSQLDTITGNHPIVNYSRGSYKGIFAFSKEDGSIYCFQNVWDNSIQISSKLKIEQCSRNDYQFNSLHYTQERSFQQVNFFEKCLGIVPVYFSNIFREELIISSKQDKELIHYNQEDTSVHSYNHRHDISLNAKLAPWSTDKVGQDFGVMNLFYWGEIKRLVYFVAEFGPNWFNQTDNIKIKLPTFLNIEDRWQLRSRELDPYIIQTYGLNEFLIPSINETNYHLLSSLSKQILFIWTRWLEIYRFDKDVPDQLILSNKLKSILYESIDYLNANAENFPDLNGIKSAFKKFSKKIQEEIGTYPAYLPTYLPLSNEYLVESESFIDEFLIHINSKTVSINLELKYEWAIKFIEAYSKVDFLDLFTFSFSFHKDIVYPVFSSGEKYFLSMFSRLFELKKELKQDDAPKNLLLMLDEAELTLHPEWQRNFLNEVVNGCKIIFEGYNLQFILSSHSPFLISDFPKGNVIFLDKNKQGNCIVHNPDDIALTFGANIHSLYRSSFFLENGFVGEFAKQKIDEVISLLNKNNKQKIESHKKEINFIIENIGEPLLRNKLREMYNGGKTVEDRIKALKAEIKQLQSLKDDRK